MKKPAKYLLWYEEFLLWLVGLVIFIGWIVEWLDLRNKWAVE